MPPAALAPWQAAQASHAKLTKLVMGHLSDATMQHGASMALAMIEFLKLCICASHNRGILAWQGWPPSSTSRAAVEASRGLLICWVVLKQSAAEVTEWWPVTGEDEHGDYSESPGIEVALDTYVSWSQLKKAMIQVKETACVGYTEAPTQAVFG